MIHVPRPAGSAPAVLTQVQAGPRETARAIEYYEKKTGKKPSFNVYSHDDVKNALGRLFNNKCAYCESRYAGTQPMAVEHWRPKNAVKLKDGTKQKPGYYWLAATWENLLPSCTDCNSERYHVVPPDMETQVLLGKQDRFPVADESKRHRSRTKPCEEIPLLLNPCLHNPEEHLEIVGEGDARGIVRPLSINGQPSEKALASIEVYALNRSNLVEERRARLLLIAEQIERVDRLFQKLDAAKTEQERESIEADIRIEWPRLERFAGADQPFAQMARQMIAPFKKKRTP